MEGRVHASVCVGACKDIDWEKRQKRKEERSCQSKLVISNIEVPFSSLSIFCLHTHMDLRFYSLTHEHMHAILKHSSAQMLGFFILRKGPISISLNQIALFIFAYWRFKLAQECVYPLASQHSTVFTRCYWVLSWAVNVWFTGSRRKREQTSFLRPI